MKIIFFVLLSIVLVVSVQSQVTVRGQITDSFGRGLSAVHIRLQATGCYDTYPEAFTVYEYYAVSNTFGYYNIAGRSDCGVYSVRVLGSRRYNEIYFTPPIYAFNNPNRENLEIVDYDFVYQ